MANDLEKTIKSTAIRVAKYVEDAATMTVDTHYIQIDDGDNANFDSAKPALRTTIRLDGDSETIVPLSKNSDGQLELNGDMYEAHQNNVNTAIEYRAKILSSLLEMMRTITNSN
ncbi:MAG: hypothetical protein AAF629_19115 [Chloroflexota bacterium]